ncbi:hypothetical protein RKD52_003572 [Metabacillus sp. SLBN-84]
MSAETMDVFHKKTALDTASIWSVRFLLVIRLKGKKTALS